MEAIEKIKEFTQHEAVELLPRGNAAIFTSLYIAKQVNPKPCILIPDQGGWFTFKTYPKLLGFQIKELKTNHGVIDIKELENNIQDASALLITSFAGYYAEQPLEEISKMCKKHNCLLIEDASGSITDDNLCNGNFSDIILGSFSDWKVVNLGYGGFISVKDKSYFDKAKEAFSLMKVHPALNKELLPLLNNKRLKYLLDLQQKVKKDLKDYKVYHQDKRGLNVITENNEEILKYCRQNNYPYLICPKYIRIKEKAISIELKRLPC